MDTIEHALAERRAKIESILNSPDWKIFVDHVLSIARGRIEAALWGKDPSDRIAALDDAKHLLQTVQMLGVNKMALDGVVSQMNLLRESSQGQDVHREFSRRGMPQAFVDPETMIDAMRRRTIG